MTEQTLLRQLILRLATDRDLPALCALYRELDPGDAIAAEGVNERVFGEILESSQFELLVAEAGGEVVATCYLNVIPNLTRGARPYGVIENVVVTEQFRNRGVGKAIVGFALDRAWARDCYKVMLQTGSRSEAKHAFYRRCGFSQTDKIAFVARCPRRT